MNIQLLKNLLSNSPQPITTDDFIVMHKGVEAYIRRLFLIGLRINGVKYETSLDVIKLSYLNNRDLINKVITLITNGSKTVADLETKSNDFKILLKLFFDFSTIYRNRVIHGVYDKIHDSETLKHCYYIDKYLIIEIEKVLISLGYKSAFDKPTDWGASRSTSLETFDQVILRLRLGSLTKIPAGIITVKNAVASTSYITF